ncbi:hypothetical protein [Paracoccus sp. IB05]|uniref:hypothetical protein n=1 Tax=Paracoccus sp. IB05 TaxID=2779367 RepID=UPI0018E7EFD2|nr:hypothetical protein [Paracoccus sp. IB05]MBJ2153182.1 hypothetical protein [Paracoccus sp. IB05]
MNRFLPAALLALIAAPAFAQDFEHIGEIRASFQGEDLSFDTMATERDGKTMSTATVGDIGGTPGLPAARVLQITGAHIVDGREAGSLHLTHYYDEHPQDGAASVIWQSSSVSYYPNRSTPPLWEMSPDTRSNVTFRFDSFYFDGETGHVSATFTGQLCRSDVPGEEADPDDCHEISGSFDTPLSGQD